MNSVNRYPMRKLALLALSTLGLASAAKAQTVPAIQLPPYSSVFAFEYTGAMNGNQAVGSVLAEVGGGAVLHHIGVACPAPVQLNMYQASSISGPWIVGGNNSDGAEVIDLGQPLSCPATNLGGPTPSYANANNATWIVGNGTVNGDGYGTGNGTQYGNGAPLAWSYSDFSTPLHLGLGSFAYAEVVGVDGNYAAGEAFSSSDVPTPVYWNLLQPSTAPVALGGTGRVYGISGNLILWNSGDTTWEQSYITDVTSPTSPITTAFGNTADQPVAIFGTIIVGGVDQSGAIHPATWNTAHLSAAPTILGIQPGWTITRATGVSSIDGCEVVFGYAVDPSQNQSYPAVWDVNSCGFCQYTGPTANAGPNQTAADPIAGTKLDGSGSTAGGLPIASYSWSEGCNVLATGEKPTVVLAPGTHNVMLTVTDGDGAQSISTVSITVAAEPTNPCPAGVTTPITAIAFGPAQDDNGTVMFEDSWPKIGDDDFNDQTLTYNYELALDANNDVVAIKATYNVLAVGAEIHNGAYVHFPGILASSVYSIARTVEGQAAASVSPYTGIAGISDLVVQIVNDTTTLFPTAGNEFINTSPSIVALSAPAVSLLIVFKTPVVMNTSKTPFDLYIQQTTSPKWQIHQPTYNGVATGMIARGQSGALFDTQQDASTATEWFVTSNGIPFALSVPDTIAWTTESEQISLLYPEIVGFGEHGGTQDQSWYENPVMSNAFAGGAGGTLPPTPKLFGADLTICTP